MPILRLILTLMFLTSLSQASLVWRPGEGWSDESTGADVSASNSSDQLDLGHKLEAKGQRDDALKAYKMLIRRWPLSFSSPEAQYRIGKIQEDEADFLAAFNSFQKMVEKYPSSAFFDQAQEEQFRIGNLYLAGEPQRIWKIPLGPSMEKAIDLYQRIIKNGPYGKYSALAQFNIGQAYEKERKYSDAVNAYQTVMDRYPNSDVAGNAQYQIGYAWMRFSSDAHYDQSAAEKSIEAFQDFILRYPNSDKIVQAQENIQKLGHRQTMGTYYIAQFYDAQKNFRAAYIYYNEVIKEDPNSDQSQLAKKRIAELRPVVSALPGGLTPDGTLVQPVAAVPDAATPVPDTSAPAANAPAPATAPDAAPAPTANGSLPASPSSPDRSAASPASLPPANGEASTSPAATSAGSTPPENAPLPQ